MLISSHYESRVVNYDRRALIKFTTESTRGGGHSLFDYQSSMLLKLLTCNFILPRYESYSLVVGLAINESNFIAANIKEHLGCMVPKMFFFF